MRTISSVAVLKQDDLLATPLNLSLLLRENPELVGHLGWDMPFMRCWMMRRVMSQRQMACVWLGCLLPAVTAGASVTSTRMADSNPSDPLVPTIAEARVVIRSGDESDSPGD